MLDFDLVQRRTVIEKYDFPVLTIYEENKKERGQQKFEFNAAAIAMLDLDEGINYVGVAWMFINSADEDKEMVIINFKGEDNKYKMAKLNKDLSFSSKKMFDLLKKNVIFDGSIQNEFNVVFHIDESTGYQYLTLGGMPLGDEEVLEFLAEASDLPIDDAKVLITEEDYAMEEAAAILEGQIN